MKIISQYTLIIDKTIFLLFYESLIGYRILMQDLKGMTDAAGDRPVILINPRLKVVSTSVALILLCHS